LKNEAGQDTSQSMVTVNGLSKFFPVPRPLFSRKEAQVIKAVNDISFTIPAGTTLGLVGESGSGKSTAGRCLIRLHRPTVGTVRIGGVEIASMNAQQLRPLRPDFQMIFQDPFASLNPRMTIGQIISEPILTHKKSQDQEDLQRQLVELMNLVGLPPRLRSKYPHEFSGGQIQRVAIARALALRPKFVVCDEPVSALDVSIQAQIINLLLDLQKELGLTYLFISHDLAIVRHVATQIAVMYMGRIVEIGEATKVFVDPKHPYTQALLSAVPVPDPLKRGERSRIVLRGEIPSHLNPPAGCSFRTRCSLAHASCAQVVPILRNISDRKVACNRLDESGSILSL
jgi:oligopeptide transport system ATP-binding protein